MNLNREEIMQIAARLSRIVRHTPMRTSSWLSSPAQGVTLVKLENLQVTGSFKIRGAANKILALKETGYAGPVLAVSAGNHGLAVAVASRKEGWPATIVVPKTVVPNKAAAIKAAGAELLLLGEDYDQAEEMAREQAKERGIPFLSPYNDREIIAGQSTVGLEMLEDDAELDAILVPVGGGGLIAGIALAMEALSTNAALIGAQAENSPGMCESLKAGRIVRVVEQPTIADGIAGNIEPGSITFDIVARSVKQIILVSEDEIRQAVVGLCLEEKMAVEPAGAVGVAAWLYHQRELPRGRVGIVISGGNIDPEKLNAWISE